MFITCHISYYCFVCWCLLSFLVLSVVSCYCSMRCLSFDSSIWSNEDRSHKSKRTITLSYNIWLNISIIIFTSPNKSTIWFYWVSNHIVNQSVFIPKFLCFKFLFVVFLINLFKNILKSSIVFFKNSIFGTHVKRIISLNSILEAWMSKFSNWFISVVHSHHNTSSREFENFESNFFGSIVWGVNHFKFSCFWCDKISSSILVSKSMSSYNNWIFPSRYISWNVFNKNWLSEDSSSKVISNCSIRRLPHLFEIKFFNSSLICCNCGTFYTNFVQFACFCCFNSHFIICFVSIFDTQVEIFNIDIKERKN